MRSRLGLTAVIVAFCVLSLFSAFSALPFPPRAAETLPAQISDAEYWKMISGFSEPDGYFQYDIVTSNEVSYQYVLPALMKRARTGGAYLGVGPEQNFTYIAALQPKIAFIIDIRRDMMLEHLLYKSIFEMSNDRAEFVGRLFARKNPLPRGVEASVDSLFQAFAKIPTDRTLADEHFKQIMANLKTKHRFPMTLADKTRIRALYTIFVREGVRDFYSSFRSPGYAALMTMTDGDGKKLELSGDAGKLRSCTCLTSKEFDCAAGGGLCRSESHQDDGAVFAGSRRDG